MPGRNLLPSVYGQMTPRQLFRGLLRLPIKTHKELDASRRRKKKEGK